MKTTTKRKNDTSSIEHEEVKDSNVAGYIGTAAVSMAAGWLLASGKSKAKTGKLPAGPNPMPGSNSGGDYQAILTAEPSNIVQRFDADGKRLGLMDLAVPMEQRSNDIIAFISTMVPLHPLMSTIANKRFANMDQVSRERLLDKCCRLLVCNLSGLASNGWAYRFRSVSANTVTNVALVTDGAKYSRDKGIALHAFYGLKSNRYYSHAGQLANATDGVVGSMFVGGHVGLVLNAIRTLHPNYEGDYVRALNVLSGWLPYYIQDYSVYYQHLFNVLNGLDFHWFENTEAPFFSYARSMPGTVIPFKNQPDIVATAGLTALDMSQANENMTRRSTSQVYEVIKTALRTCATAHSNAL